MSATMQTLEFRSRVIFLCASALESARILLLNLGRPRVFRADLQTRAVSSGATSWTIRSAPAPTARSPAWKTARPSATVRMASTCRAFVTSRTSIRSSCGVTGFQGGRRAQGLAPRREEPWFGAEFKNALLKSLGPWGFGMGGWAECLPRHDNYVALHPTLKDKWGIPALHIQCTWGRMSSRSSRIYR